MIQNKNGRIVGIAAAMVFCTMASADQLDLQVLLNGSPSPSAVSYGDVVLVTIEGSLSSVSGAGLALWGVNVDADSSVLNGAATFDITDPGQFLLAAPASMANFDRNLGFTNPPGPPSPITGYSGTPSGTILLQVGGGQNTIGNAGPPAYPIGTVTTGFANGGPVILAEGILVTPATGGGEIVLNLSACFANVLDAPAVGPPYSVSTASCTMSGAVVSFGQEHPCLDADVNCDGIVTGLDLAEIQAPLNWAMTPGAAANPRADVNNDNIVSGLDLAEVQAPLNWGTMSSPCLSFDCP